MRFIVDCREIDGLPSFFFPRSLPSDEWYFLLSGFNSKGV